MDYVWSWYCLNKDELAGVTRASVLAIRVLGQQNANMLQKKELCMQGHDKNVLDPRRFVSRSRLPTRRNKAISEYFFHNTHYIHLFDYSLSQLICKATLLLSLPAIKLITTVKTQHIIHYNTFYREILHILLVGFAVINSFTASSFSRRDTVL